jgi:hypothetical protein
VDAAARRAIAEQLLGDQALDPAAVEERAGSCGSAGYWTSLCPGLSIGSRATALDEIRVPDGSWSDAARQIHREGYAATPVFLPPPVLARLNGAIDAVVAAGWPSTFAWVFDDFWSAARTPAVRRLLDSALGPGSRQVPHVWVHVVPAVAGARGWGPHKDGGLARGSRTHLSLWIALTDASVDNGCMYVLPRSAASASLVDRDWSSGVMPMADAVRLVSGVRALPAPAGAALAWDFDLLHWSGVRTGGGPARRSLSLEFIGATAEPSPDEHPLIACGDDRLPTFEQRLTCIAEGIMQYGKHEPGVQRFRPLAERMLSRTV